MSGERKNITQQNYGTLIMRPYTIAGNSINAFYDASDDLVFVLDNTITESKPNVLLVINPDSDKKWDEILSSDYGVDLETIRPKQDNKYQKLDIEYSGLAVYDNLIQAFLADDDMEDFLNQLNVLRDSAARHSAMMRLNTANEVIAKTNVTIVKTKETIVRLQERIKTLRSKLTATRKEIGKVSTKQSAAKILRLESQIEATNEKLKRAKKRLESAQRRLEAATVDAELASNLLNQPATEIKPSKPVMVAPKHEVQVIEESDDDDEEEEVEPESDVKPLFEEDPKILNEDIAFKPISFDAPTFENINQEPENIPVINKEVFEETVKEEVPVIESFQPIASVEPEAIPESNPVIESFQPVVSSEPESKPVLESMTPVIQEETHVVEEETAPVETEDYVAPVVPIAPTATVPPVSPMINKAQDIKSEVSTTTSKPSFVYYMLLGVLIVLSIFTLWLYQKNVKPTTPVLTAKAEQSVVVSQPKEPESVKPTEVSVDDDMDNAFIDDITEPEPVVTTEPDSEPIIVDPLPKPILDEPVPVIEEATEEQPVEEEVVVEPEIMDDVPSMVMTSGQEEEEVSVVSEDEIIASKPVYEPGTKYDDMFVDEGYEEPAEDAFYDEEEAFYQSEQDM